MSLADSRADSVDYAFIGSVGIHFQKMTTACHPCCPPREYRAVKNSTTSIPSKRRWCPGSSSRTGTRPIAPYSFRRLPHAAGAIYIIDKARVHPVDAPFAQAVRVISKWGSGSKELLEGMRRPQLDTVSNR